MRVILLILFIISLELILIARGSEDESDIADTTTETQPEPDVEDVQVAAPTNVINVPCSQGHFVTHNNNCRQEFRRLRWENVGTLFKQTRVISFECSTTRNMKMLIIISQSTKCLNENCEINRTKKYLKTISHFIIIYCIYIWVGKRMKCFFVESSFLFLWQLVNVFVSVISDIMMKG